MPVASVRDRPTTDAPRDAGAGQAHAPQVQTSLAELVLDALPCSLAVLNREGTIIATNATWQRFATENGGTAARTGVGVNYLAVCRGVQGDGADAATAAWTGIREVLNGTRAQFLLEYLFPMNGEERWYLMVVNALPALTGGAIVWHLDITDRKQLEQELARHAFLDPLTKLPNRIVLMDRLTHALARREHPFGGVAVLFIDLDDFKPVNDCYGHGASDGLLVTIGQRIPGCVCPSDTVARLGGDEFVVLLEGPPFSREPGRWQSRSWRRSPNRWCWAARSWR